MASETEQFASDLASLTENVKGLVDGQKAIQGIVTQQGNTQAQLSEAITGISKSLAKGLTINQPGEKPKEINLEEASISDLAKYIMTEVSTMNKETREQFTKDMDDLKNNISADSRQAELDTTRKVEGNEDLDDFLPEMATLAKVNPNLSMPQLLHLARSQDPEKAKTLREEIDAKAKEGAPPKEEETAFGGLTPTSGSSDVSDGDEKDKPKSITDGLLKAWDEVVPKDMNKSAQGEDAIF